MYQQHPDGVRHNFVKNEDGSVGIDFFDPSYIRSDVIVIDRSDMSVHAVLHETSYFIGNLEEDLVLIFEEAAEARLSARHGFYESGSVAITAPVTVTG